MESFFIQGGKLFFIYKQSSEAKTSSSNYKRLEGSLLKCHIRAIVPLISGVRKGATRN